MHTHQGLIAEHLSFSIGSQAILTDISVDFPAGAVIGVLGPNGAGKTSLLKLLSGQLKAKGEVYWQGQCLSALPSQALAQQIAIVNQINDSVFALTLKQIVRMGLLPHQSLLARQTRAESQRIDDGIELVGLTHKSAQEFCTLSGGEQQRGLIARALVQQAPLLILDEPVNHLDVYYQHQILHLLHQIAAELGKTVVMSLHDINLAARYCDHLCILQQGKLVANGQAKLVLEPDVLETVFKVPCRRVEDDSELGFRIEFCPTQQTDYNFEEWR